MPAASDPDRIGRFEIAARIGRGGMGTVYRATDPVIGRTVAIKVLHVDVTALEGDADEIRARFRQEVRSTGTLRHPNIVTVYDYGVDADRPFIVMEHVEGRTLAEMLRDGEPITLPHKLRLVRQLCSALDYAHGLDIIHRDIKPANLIVDRAGDLKVLDFGIARIGEERLTRAGVVLGTLAYMSPEQIDGAAVDRRSDVFSVGAVLYELLASRRAFRGETASGVVNAVLNEQPTPLTELCPDLDPAFQRCVERALRKDPAERYQTLGQLSADLAAIEAGRAAADASTAAIDSSSAATSTLTTPVDRAGARRVGRRFTWMGWAAALVAIAGAITALVLSGRSGATPNPPAVAATVPTIAPVPAASTTIAPPAPQPVAAPTQAGEVRPRPVNSSRTDRPIAGDADPIVKTRTAYEQARELLAGKSNPASQLKAAALFQESCAHDEAKGCRELAQMYVRATGVARDEARAAELLGRACELGDADACNDAGVILRDGSGSAKKRADTAALFQRACDGGSREACNNLALGYARGSFVPRDDARAAELFRRACDAGLNPACDNLGRAYQQGLGVGRDDAVARSLYQKACDANGIPACVDLGAMLMQGLGGPRDPVRGLALFQRACDDGRAAGCVSLGVAYFRGDGVPQDDARAAGLYEQGCNAGGPRGCANLAFMYAAGRGVARDEARSVFFVQKACDGDVAESCQVLADRYEQGRGVERNPARAAELRQRASQLRGRSGGASSTPPPGPDGGVSGGVAGDVGTPAAPAAPRSPTAPVRVGGTIKPPARTKYVRPEYPAIARSARVQGVVTVEAVIGQGGAVVDAKVLRSIPLLDQAALDAVRQWQFAPTVVDGVRVPVIMSVPVAFSLQ